MKPRAGIYQIGDNRNHLLWVDASGYVVNGNWEVEVVDGDPERVRIHRHHRLKFDWVAHRVGDAPAGGDYNEVLNRFVRERDSVR